MYQSCTWLQSILWTVVCARDLFAIGWLLAGYCLAMAQNQNTSRHTHSHILQCMYQTCTSLQAILWTVERSRDFWLCRSDGCTDWLMDSQTLLPRKLGKRLAVLDVIIHICEGGGHLEQPTQGHLEPMITQSLDLSKPCLVVWEKYVSNNVLS